MKFQSWKHPSKKRLGVVQASQEASAKRQAQIKEAESFLRWFRGFGFDAQPVFWLQNWKEDAIYHFRVFLSAVTIILVFLFGSFLSTQQSRLFAITSTSSATNNKASKESPKWLVTRARSRWKKNNYNWLRNYDNWRAEGQVKFWVRELPNLVDFALPYVLLG